MAKLMVSIRDENFRLLSLEARERGITIQELIRAVIVPDWVRGGNILGTRRENEPALPLTVAREEREIPLIGRRRP